MYRVVAVYTAEPEWLVDAYETREEAEEVARDVFEEYDDEVLRVEVRDRWREVVMVVGGGD